MLHNYRTLRRPKEAEIPEQREHPVPSRPSTNVQFPFANREPDQRVKDCCNELQFPGFGQNFVKTCKGPITMNQLFENKSIQQYGALFWQKTVGLRWQWFDLLFDFIYLFKFRSESWMNCFSTTAEFFLPILH